MEFSEIIKKQKQYLVELESALKNLKKIITNTENCDQNGQSENDLTKSMEKVLHYLSEHKSLSVETSKNLEISEKEKSALQKRVEYYKLLYERGLDLSCEQDISKLLNSALDAVLDITNAERGFVAVLGDDNTFEFVAARAIDEEEIKDPHSNVSKTVLNEVLNVGEKISSGQIQEDSRFKNQSSIVRLNLTSVISIPLKMSSKIFGAIYLDNNKSHNAFNIKSLSILQTFADQIGRAVDAALRVENLQKEHNTLLRAAASKIKFRHIIGNSKIMDQVLLQVIQVAPTDATVLLLGESGTGKELIARAIHENSDRADKAFIAINCSAIPANLLESELFGHEKGSFTGAISKKIGKFEAADTGTLFLDEIADMVPELQVKLLRVIQTMEFQRLGSNDLLKVDVRLIAATNKPLKEKVKNGEFREDLFYRLNVFALKLPQLKERKEDIPSLVYHFFENYKERHNKVFINKISPEFFVILTEYDWPGNVRELENVIERAVILCQEKVLTFQNLPQELTQTCTGFIESETVGENFESMVNGFKRRLILRILHEKNNNITEVSKTLKINRSYLYRLMTKLGISD